MRVWVTREEERDGPLCTALRRAGLDVVLEPVVERRVVSDAAVELSELTPDDWLVLTSPYAIDAVAETPARVPRVAVVGGPSRAAAERRGFRVELVSAGGTARSLFAALRARCSSGTVCYPRSSLVEPPEPWGNVRVVSPVLYETVPTSFDRAVSARVDVVAVASPSAAEAVGPLDLHFASIGPSTSAALRRIGVDVWVEAADRSFESLAQAIADQPSDSRHHRA